MWIEQPLETAPNDTSWKDQQAVQSPPLEARIQRLKEM